MRYLIDTNVLSEFIAKLPEPRVVTWLAQHQEQDLYISVISIGEIQQGISRLAESTRRIRLAYWLQDQLLVDYHDFIVPIDRDIMLHWGQMTAELIRVGRPMSYMDSLIAATVQFHDFVLVTRNTNDFSAVDIAVVNPWLG